MLERVQLDPDQTEALTARGKNAIDFRWEWDEARAAFEHALRVSPNDAEVHNFYGDYFTTIGDFASAEKFERRAMELDMLAGVHARDLADLMMSMGRYDEALKVLEKAKQSKPDITIDIVARAFTTRNETDTLAIKEGLSEAGLHK